MTTHLNEFVRTFQELFPGQTVPPVPSSPDQLSLTHHVAIRDSNPQLWQNMFGGQGSSLPADVQQRLLTGQVFPEDESALRAANMDAYANQAASQRQQIIDRARAATRAREKAQYEAEAERFRKFSEGSLLERLAASPLSEQAIQSARDSWGVHG